MLFVDRLLKQKPYKNREAEALRQMLRKPAQNHSSNGDFGRVDRWVFDGDMDDLEKACPAEVLGDLFDLPLMFPSVPMWLEMKGKKYGFLVHNEAQPKVTALCLYHRSVTPLWELSAEALTSFDEVLKVRAFPYLSAELVPDFSGREELLAAGFNLFRRMLFAITQHRAVETRRIDPGKSAIGKYARFRASQTPAPLNSYNRVRVKAQQTSIHQTSSGACGMAGGVRAYTRTGHWRLIKRCAEPFWTWVKHCDCGNEKLGRIVKERHFLPPQERSGYAMPNFAGRPGQTVKAEKARLI